MPDAPKGKLLVARMDITAPRLNPLAQANMQQVYALLVSKSIMSRYTIAYDRDNQTMTKLMQMLLGKNIKEPGGDELPAFMDAGCEFVMELVVIETPDDGQKFFIEVRNTRPAYVERDESGKIIGVHEARPTGSTNEPAKQPEPPSKIILAGT